MTYTSIPVKKEKRTDLLGWIGWTLGIEKLKWKYYIFASGEKWTAKQHNDLINKKLW